MTDDDPGGQLRMSEASQNITAMHVGNIYGSSEANPEVNFSSSVGIEQYTLDVARLQFGCPAFFGLLLKLKITTSEAAKQLFR